MAGQYYKNIKIGLWLKNKNLKNHVLFIALVLGDMTSYHI